MHVARFLSHWIKQGGVIKHSSRSTALVRVVASALGGAKLSLTQLGRGRSGAAYEKHHIKAVDRLLGDQHLHRERVGIYASIARAVLLTTKQPVIIVDWSDFEPGQHWAMLKAAIPLGGRSITLYEQVFPFARYNSPSAHREFLDALHAVIPVQCKPIIVTDAGFRGPWFKAVESYGWDWVGRVRNMIKYYNASTGRWCYTKSLYEQATPKVHHLGEVTLSRKRGYHFRMYLVRAYKVRLGRPPGERRRKTNRSMYRRLHRAPWLLATSLPHERGSGRRIKRLYSQRMQVEETFRDLKSHRWGLGLRYSRCKHAERIQVLLLIAALATLVMWLVGLCGRALHWMRRFQANTERTRPVLSTVFLGRQLIRRRDIIFTQPLIRHAFHDLQRLVAQALPA